MQTDVMQSASFYKAWAWFETNKKQVATGALIAAVVVLVVWFWIWQRGQKEMNASEALSNVTLPQFNDPSGHANNAQAFLQIAEKYPKSSAGIRAMLLAGASLFVEGKYPEARAQFEKFRHEHQDSAFVAQASLGVAACLDAEGKAAEAINAYKTLADHHPTENVVSQARFALGRLYEAQNKPEDARVQYEKVAQETYTSIGSEAGMRLEELRIKYPNAFPAPVLTPGTTLTLPATNILPTNSTPAVVPPASVPDSNAIPAAGSLPTNTPVPAPKP